MKFVNDIKKYKEENNVGFLSDLKKAILKNKESHSYHCLYDLGINIDNKFMSMVAGLCAYSPTLDCNYGNFGTTCNKMKFINIKSPIKSLDSRFNRIISAYNSNNFIVGSRRDLLISTIKWAQKLEIPINYSQLYFDLKDFNNDVKIKWAEEFWSQEGKICGYHS